MNLFQNYLCEIQPSLRLEAQILKPLLEAE